MQGDYIMTKNILKKSFIYIILVLGCIITLLPFLWMISTSLKPFNEIFLMPPKLIPSKIMWKIMEKFKVKYLY